jgi:hypothetical protein
MLSFLQYLIENNNSNGNIRTMAHNLTLYVIQKWPTILNHRSVSFKDGTIQNTKSISEEMAGTEEIKRILGQAGGQAGGQAEGQTEAGVGIPEDNHSAAVRAAIHNTQNHNLVGGGDLDEIRAENMKRAVHVLTDHLTELINPPPIRVDESKSPAWTRKEGKDPKGGLNRKGVASYRRANPGSKLKMAVTKDPSKIKKGSKDDKRRKSFCSRMTGMKRKLTSAKTARDPDSRINKALRKWNC